MKRGLFMAVKSLSIRIAEKLKYKGLFKILSILSHNKQRGMIDSSLAVLYNQWLYLYK